MNLDEARSALDRIAQAIYHSRPRKVQWAELAENRCKSDYRKMAMAAVEVIHENVEENHEDNCARCAFENSIEEIVYAGNFIDAKLSGTDNPERLKESEMEILKLARSWLADDAIFRCLNES